jgi:hypothetical protein
VFSVVVFKGDRLFLLILVEKKKAKKYKNKLHILHKNTKKNNIKNRLKKINKLRWVYLGSRKTQVLCGKGLTFFSFFL